MESKLTKNKSGKLVVLITNNDGAISPGMTIDVCPDLGIHPATGVQYQFCVSALGREWTAREGRYVIDEDLSEDGQIRAGSVTVRRQYAYGSVIGSHSGRSVWY